MERVDEPIRQDPRDDVSLTLQLFDKMFAFHSVPRLRQRLARVSFPAFESQVSAAFERDLIYLISGLSSLAETELDPGEFPNLPREAGDFLRRCDSCGITICQFLTGSAKSWDGIRPKYREILRNELGATLLLKFPGLPTESADRFTGYLLTRSLARFIPSFPFLERHPKSGLIALRAQANLPWTLATSPEHYLPVLETHFPEVDWSHPSTERELWFTAVRLVSKFSPRTATVLKHAFEGTSHLSTSRVQNRNKLIHVVFFSAADADLFRFNLRHHAKLAGTFYEIFDSSLSEYRRGYPRLSGLTGEALRYEMKAGHH